VEDGIRQAVQRIQRLLQHAGRAHARIGDHQGPPDADALAFLAQQAHGVELELDLGDVVDEGHGGCVAYDGELHCKPATGAGAAIRVTFLPQFPELTPAMRSVLERMARAGHPPLYSLPPRQARAAYEAGAGVLEVPRPELARGQDLEIAV